MFVDNFVCDTVFDKMTMNIIIIFPLFINIEVRPHTMTLFYHIVINVYHFTWE